MHRRALILIALCPVLVACGDFAATSAGNDALPNGSSRAALIAECTGLGVQPNTVDMDRCVAAPTDARRALVADQSVYGTN